MPTPLLSAQRTPPGRLRTATLAIVIVVATMLGIVVAPTVAAASSSAVVRANWIGGKDLYATSVLMSQQMGGARVLYLVSGESGGDALSVPPAARAEGAHVLMVRRDSIPSTVATEIRRLNPRYVHIVGSRSVLSDRLWAATRQLLPGARINRVGTNAGDRVDSAIELSQQIRHANGRLGDVFIIGRNGYSDGLAAGNVAARMGAAVFPAIGDPRAWAQRLLPHIQGPRNIVFVGSTSVLPDDYLRALQGAGLARKGAEFSRIGGPDRYATNALMIQRFVPSIVGNRAILVAGNGHGDTIGASVYAAEVGSVLMLSGRFCHEHTRVPEQLQRLGVRNVTGIGTKFWITLDALRLTVCDQAPDAHVTIQTDGATGHVAWGERTTTTFTLRNHANFGVEVPLEMHFGTNLFDNRLEARGRTIARGSGELMIGLWPGETLEFTASGRAEVPADAYSRRVSIDVIFDEYRYVDYTEVDQPRSEHVLLGTTPGEGMHGSQVVGMAAAVTNVGDATGRPSVRIRYPAELVQPMLRFNGDYWRSSQVGYTLPPIAPGETVLVEVMGIASGPTTGGEYSVVVEFVGVGESTIPFTVLPAPSP
ncbi:cell wall-binding repeat-containing protein [Agrococcus sp. ARC_14]|uniref:cell wall-binding repeat-containing protein n=1 Tax=Agrococcus sp. ARC_14 TaxID=2919927 RepID=UPI001F066633|nr:cell wall-binding repeat-containing protein [Agrococcus sp. ARC_14]MCH1881432.1 cell wall-binding repeat-containing protein [Agrococcus sp. ARC_14]